MSFPSDITNLISRSWQALQTMPLNAEYITAETVPEICDKMESGKVKSEEIGVSRDGRPIMGLTLGNGTTTITVKGNAHADEPAGVTTCVLLAGLLSDHPDWRPLLDRYRFRLVPTANPDGLYRNQAWLTTPFDLRQYFRHVYRDLPKDDVEFGYASSEDGAGSEGTHVNIRPENMACADFFDASAPISSHLSLHSIVFTGGAWFLVGSNSDLALFEPALQFITDACQDEALPLHDEDRGGQKGFSRLRPGFHSIPTVEGMQAFFQQSGDESLTQQFRINSMQYAMRNCQARFAAVSEIPYAYDRALANMTPTEHTRVEQEQRRIAVYSTVLDELSEILDDCDGSIDTEDGQFWMDYFQSYLTYRRSGLISLTRDLDRFAERPATLRDLYEVNLLQTRHLTFNAAAGAKLCQLSGDIRREKYNKLFNERFDDMMRRFRFQSVPLDTQVRLQLAIILAGLLVR